MDILIDTNIILDLLFKRDGYKLASDLFKIISDQGYTAYITASAVTDLFYIIHKNIRDTNETYKSMEYIFKLVNVIGVTPEDINDAFLSRWKDFEDCVQYTTAKNNNMDYIVTANIKDYKDDTLNIAITPGQCIEVLKK